MRLASILAAYLVLLGLGGELWASGFRVVVHESNPVTSLTAAEVSELFLGKTLEWEDGLKVRPVDLPPSSPVREAFSQKIHGKGVGVVRSHWQTMIFSGRGAPPPERPSDREVLGFVRSKEGAVGYVAEEAVLGEGIKEVQISDED